MLPDMSLSLTHLFLSLTELLSRPNAIPKRLNFRENTFMMHLFKRQACTFLPSGDYELMVCLVCKKVYLWISIIYVSVYSTEFVISWQLSLWELYLCTIFQNKIKDNFSKLIFRWIENMTIYGRIIVLKSKPYSHIKLMHFKSYT